jgi:hypothetical protein
LESVCANKELMQSTWSKRKKYFFIFSFLFYCVL